MNDSDVAQVMEIASVDRAIAQTLLEAADGNVSKAIENYFMHSTLAPETEEEPEIRAPMRRQQATLIESSQQNLQKCFLPPHHLIYNRPWTEVLTTAKRKNFWVLVNIQDETLFDSLRLNQDIWKHHFIIDIVSQNFIFWQAKSDSEIGTVLCRVYDLKPLGVYIIDPYSNQKIETINLSPLSVDEIAMQLTEFLQNNELPPNQDSSGTDSMYQRTSSVYNFASDDKMAALARSLECTKHEDHHEAQSKRSKAVVRKSHPVIISSDEEETDEASTDKEGQYETYSSMDKSQSATEDQNTISTAHPEPPVDAANAVELCIVFPDGSRLRRRFYRDEPIDALRQVILDSEKVSKPFSIMRSNPRIDLLSASKHDTFASLNIRRELLRVEII